MGGVSAGPGRLVAIVGAGIVGVSTAIWLQRMGHRVVLIDRAGPAAGASHGNGGVLASASIVPVTVPGLIRRAPRMALDPTQPLYVRWGHLPRMAPWLARYLRHANARDAARIAAALAPIVGDSLEDHRALAQGTGAERWIVPSDYLFLYRDRAAYEADGFAWGLRREHGFEWEELEGAALRAHDPIFGDAIGFAARLGGHGRIADPGAYVKALAAHVEARGGRLLRAEVEDLVREGGRVTGLRAAGGTIPCDAAVIATGAWSRRLAARLGLDVPLESERGYHLELWEPSAMPRAPVMVSHAKFVATPMEGRLRLAGHRRVRRARRAAAAAALRPAAPRRTRRDAGAHLGARGRVDGPPPGAGRLDPADRPRAGGAGRLARLRAPSRRAHRRPEDGAPAGADDLGGLAQR